MSQLVLYDILVLDKQNRIFNSHEKVATASLHHHIIVAYWDQINKTEFLLSLQG